MAAVVRVMVVLRMSFSSLIGVLRVGMQPGDFAWRRPSSDGPPGCKVAPLVNGVRGAPTVQGFVTETCRIVIYA